MATIKGTIMEVLGKVWGNTRKLFEKNNVEIHRIEARGGTFCSEHKHEHKFNAFYVEKGQLRVKVWKNSYDLVDETVIGAKEMTVVAPGEFHQFEAITDVVAYEIYWVELNGADIQRRSVGGGVKDSA